jgi:selenide, water dikinase
MSSQIMDKSESGGCGCKIPSTMLSKILSQTAKANTVLDENVILGFESSDDCAVYDIGEKYLLFTTDFFSPIVNDPYVFGQLAASNAVSDIFASGGTPLIANSIMANCLCRASQPNDPRRPIGDEQIQCQHRWRPYHKE